MSTMNTVGRPTTPIAVESKPATLTGGRGLLQNEALIFEGDRSEEHTSTPVTG